MSSTATKAAQLLSISTSLIASGGIAALSLFSTPQLQSQPASRSLPATRWLFSRGSHIFPQAAFLSSSGFIYLAYQALPPSQRAVVQLVASLAGGSGVKVNGYLAAAALALSIAPVTSFMIPTNFELIKLNEERGGARSANSARQQGDAAEFTDLSGPQTQTDDQTSEEDDERTSQLLSKFAALNMIRAVLIGAGGMVGLWTALL